MKFSKKLILLFSSILAAALLISGSMAYFSETAILEDQIRKKLEGQAFHAMDKIDRMLFERKSDMRLLATDPVISSRRSTSGELTRRMRAFQAANKLYISLSFFDLKRMRIADTLGKDIGKQHSFSETWRDIERGKDFVMAITMSEAMKRPVMCFTALVRDEKGAPFAVVSARMALAAIYEIAEETYRGRADGKIFMIELLDRNGLILYSSYNERGILRERSEDWEYIQKLLSEGKTAGSARHEYQGEDEISAFAVEKGYQDFTGNGWVLTICTSAKAAFVPAYEHGVRHVKIYLAIGFVALLGIIIFSSTVTKPLKELRSAAAEIGKGNLEVAVEVGSRDELGELAHTFNEMASALKESEGKYRDLAELLPQIVYEVDAQGRLMFANRHALELFGYTPENVVKGMNVMDVLVPEDRARLMANTEKALSGEKLDNVEYTALRKDGSTFPFLTFVVPVIRDGNIVGTRGIGIDITERRKIEQELQKFFSLVENSLDFIGIASLDGKVLYLNLAARNLVGLDRDEETTSKRIIDFIFDEDVHQVQEKILGSSFWRGEFRLRHYITHASIPVEMAGFTVTDMMTGRAIALATVIRDITERKKAEEAIRKANEELELKVRERTKQLLDAQDELVRKEKLATLGQLAGTVGHELRNPLGVMNNAVYFLRTVLADADETTKEYLGIIKSEIAGAERIVSDLLDAVRTKPPHPQLVLAEDLIRMSLENCRTPEGVTIEIKAETRRPVLIDPTQMKQVFINLINNAVGAMPKGGTLKITAEEDRNANLVRCVFRDDGVGIAPENLANLFQPLFTTKARGIGLGLVVVKNLTEANGGKVSVESEIGKGTVFTVTLPATED